MKIYNRKTTRLKNYDYSSAGAYFITICSYKKECIFSHIVGEGFPLPQLYKNGKIVDNCILNISKKYPCVKVDKYIIMPNHIHIILINENDGRGNPSPTITSVIGWLKYTATKNINQASGNIGKKIFQRSFHDHIIRDEKDYLKIWNYIDTNPSKWNEDCFYIE